MLSPSLMHAVRTGKISGRGEEVMHEFDRISGNKFFSQLYESYIVENIFPPVENAFDNLGFEVSGFGQNSGWTETAN